MNSNCICICMYVCVYSIRQGEDMHTYYNSECKLCNKGKDNTKMHVCYTYHDSVVLLRHHVRIYTYSYIYTHKYIYTRERISLTIYTNRWYIHKSIRYLIQHIYRLSYKYAPYTALPKWLGLISSDFTRQESRRVEKRPVYRYIGILVYTYRCRGIVIRHYVMYKKYIHTCMQTDIYKYTNQLHGIYQIYRHTIYTYAIHTYTEYIY